jgi:conjugative transfer region protein TrbK
MRTPRLTLTAMSRATGFVLVGATIVATALHFRDDRPTASSVPAARLADPLAAKLARCQAMGMAAQNDAACTAAWAENRRRFFTYRPASSASADATNHPDGAP